MPPNCVGFVLFDEGVKRGLIGVFVMELLQIMRRAINVERVGSGEIGQEQRVGPRPAVADRGLVQHLEARRLALAAVIATGRPEGENSLFCATSSNQ